MKLNKIWCIYLQWADVYLYHICLVLNFAFRRYQIVKVNDVKLMWIC